MSNNKHKSAKDIAFDRERMKLRGIITALREENARLKIDINAQDIAIAELKSALRLSQSELEKVTGVDIETYARDLNNRNTITQLLGLMKGIL